MSNREDDKKSSLLRQIREKNKLTRQYLTYHKISNNPNDPPDHVTDPINMRPNGKYLLLSHGRLMTGFSFRVPKNINFITLTRFSICTLHPKFDNEINDFYKAGHTIFENNDLSKKLTESGKLLQEKLKVKEPNIHFKNHLGETIANEMLLAFTSKGAGLHSGIVELNRGGTKKIKNVYNLYNSYTVNDKGRLGARFKQRAKLNQILLSTLLSMYDDNITNQNKKLTFILVACRSFSNNNSEREKSFARNVSNAES